MQRVLTTAEVAGQLGLSPSTVQKYARRGDIPFEMTPGGHRRYNLDEVRRSLYPAPSALEALDVAGSLGVGSALEMSLSARLERDARSTAPSIGERDGRVQCAGDDALDELFRHARRVLVSTGR